MRALVFKRKGKKSPRRRHLLVLGYAGFLLAALACGYMYSGGREMNIFEENEQGSRKLASVEELEKIYNETDCVTDGIMYPEDLFLSHPYCKSDGKFLMVFHFLGVLYMFYGIGLVCDDYFVPALEEMSERYQITEDVAGATFMAAGGSAPEFFTSLMGVTVSKNDVGFGTIVGSAVFNVLFVIGVCGVFANETLELTWWPLFRDCNYYIFSLLILSYFIRDGSVSFYEALFLFMLYLGYVTIMKFNIELKTKVNACVPWGEKVVPIDAAQEAGDKIFARSERRSSIEAKEGNDSTTNMPPPSAMRRRRSTSGILAEVRRAKKAGEKLPTQLINDLEEVSDSFKFRQGKLKKKKEELADVEGGMGKFKAGVQKVIENNEVLEHAEHILQRDSTEEKLSKLPEDPNLTAPPMAEEEAPDGPDDDDDGPPDPFEMPDDAAGKIMWAITRPIDFSLYYTIPQCGVEEKKHLYLVAFAMSLVWIAIYAYLMVWWIIIMGSTLNFNSTVMGLTVIAAGTSIPDALSSVAVAREGYGDMAVSSSIGSNVFDILVGLPVPWMIKTGIIDKMNSEVPIKSTYLLAQTITLIMMVAFLITSIMATGWRLSKKLGGIMFILYAVFLVISLYMEFSEPEWLSSKNLKW
ncbi:hypothetical protein TrVE_jg10476 [Triparma verrucosa]|uniref:Sodium/calcium exchanger membrane region domain-containing protein n=1 Tax=Triparma verrucosa TaxID=1606542 RepID=A0A9W7CL46_9STRA|nr:hypothetical protein TrVE_jg10476 [Triparma verrucosa]